MIVQELRQQQTIIIMTFKVIIWTLWFKHRKVAMVAQIIRVLILMLTNVYVIWTTII